MPSLKSSAMTTGRRIEYDFDKFGDSPVCLDQGKEEIVGKIATVQGYGLNEHGKSINIIKDRNTISKCKTKKLLIHLIAEYLYPLCVCSDPA